MSKVSVLLDREILDKYGNSFIIIAVRRNFTKALAAFHTLPPGQ